MQAIAPSVMMSRVIPDAVHYARADAANAGGTRDLDLQMEMDRRVEAARTGGSHCHLVSGSAQRGGCCSRRCRPRDHARCCDCDLNRFVDPEVAQMYRDISADAKS